MKKKITMIALLMCSTAILLPKTSDAQQQQSNENETIAAIIQKEHDGRYLDSRKTKLYVTNKKKNFAVAVGGAIRGVFGVDFDGYIQNSYNNGFVVPYIPNNFIGKSKSQFLASAATSQLYVKVAGQTSRGHEITGFVSTNFVTNGNYPVLRQAYVKAFGFTVGQAWNLLADINYYPVTIDYWSPSGVTGFRNPLIRYENVLGMDGQWGYGGEIAFPTVNAEYMSQYEHPIVQSVPDMSAYFEFKWGDNLESKVRIAGIYRYMAYYDDVKVSSTCGNGWGVQIGGRINILPKLQFFYRGTVGKGIASYINDLSTMKLDMMPNIQRDGKLATLPVYGAYAGLQYNINERFLVSATYSQAGVKSIDKVSHANDDYKYSQYVVANGFYNILDNLQVGAEMLYGRKSLYDTKSTSAFRFNMLLQLTF